MDFFPIVRASGTSYEVGLAIGKTLGPSIESTVRKVQQSAPDLQKIYDSLASYQEETYKYFPQYIEEIRGIAYGSGLSFESVFLGNVIELLNPDRNALDHNHCTILGLPQDGGYILGHNEDAQGYTSEDLYILDATVNGNHLFGFSYIDGMIGAAVGVNSYGLVQAINSLPDNDVRVGVPRNIIARAVLDCKTLAEAEEIIRSTPRASGYNHVLVQGDELWNIECNATEYRIEKKRNSAYAHTNHCVTDLPSAGDVPELDIGDSKTRYEKAKRLLGSADSVDSLKSILSDSTVPQIAKPQTLGSMIINPAIHEAHVHYGTPESDSFRLMKYSV